MTESIPGPFFTTATPSDHIKEENTSNAGYFEGLSENSIHSFFEIDATSEWIKNGKHRRIALQFPDSLLPYSKRVTKLIESKIHDGDISGDEKKTFVLADTSYRSCCVDEVAAAHADCTALVHFGEACHSAPTDKIDVKYVLGNMPTFIDDFKSQLRTILDQLSSDNIVLLMDSCFAHEQTKVEGAIKDIVPPSRHVECALLPSESSLKENREIHWSQGFDLCLQLLLRLQMKIRCEMGMGSKRHQILGLRRFLVLQTLRLVLVVLVVRLVLVVQLVLVVLVLQIVLAVLELLMVLVVQLVQLVLEVHVRVVRIINVPKLSNFSTDIDVFVLLSCPFGVVLDSSDYFRPVVSFFEAEIALNPAKTWAADFGWSAEFAAFLEDKIETEVSEDSGDFSLISGKVRVQNKEDEKGGDGPKSMVIYNPGYCNDRTWKGLDDGVNTSNDSTAMTEGRSGIAQGYSGK
ncbi:hypothetical protein CAEBREN_02601 [Caenorhabditis brenneri]|uniref:2-(3-amino-3-carboxypropyl)histidine synthase subunit 2 n=1 Tax=Caenorhabditis brenneri TaxID=135651 RepID=G0MVK5_CAEBE|nr:hypothetical protein CAEBREN_02601 [Caenorhabditis brenneri]